MQRPSASSAMMLPEYCGISISSSAAMSTGITTYTS